MDNLTAFRSLLAWSEGTSTNRLTKNDGYDVIVSGPDGPEVFTDYSQHPFEHRPPKFVRPGLKSTASGRYQVLCWVYLSYKRGLGLKDFSPASQDAIATQMIRECHALDLVGAGKIAEAITACSSRWASLSGSQAGQNPHPLPVLMSQWQTIIANGTESA